MSNPTHTTSRADAGYTLVELLIAVLVLGILASVVVFAISGISGSATESACATDERQLAVAAEVYAASHSTGDIDATGTGNDRYEQTLVDSGLLKAASEMHDLGADGALTKETDSRC